MTLTEFDQMEIVHRLAMIAAHCEHAVYLPAEAGVQRCAACGSPHAGGYRAVAGAVPVPASAPSSEDAVRRVRDTVEPNGWSRIDVPPDLDSHGYTRDNKCGYCHQSTGTGHKAECQNPMVMRERELEARIRRPHSPDSHGNEFWSSNCREPVCVAERERLRRPSWLRAYVPEYVALEREREKIMQRIHTLIADYDDESDSHEVWSRNAVAELRKIAGLDTPTPAQLAEIERA